MVSCELLDILEYFFLYYSFVYMENIEKMQGKQFFTISVTDLN